MNGDIELPKFVRQIVGLFLLWIAFVCAVGSVYMILSPIISPNLKYNISNPTVVLIGSGALVVSIFGMMLCWRIVSGRRAARGGLFTPRALRVIATIFGVISALGLSYSIISGQFDLSKHALNLGASFFGTLGLFALARKREE